jgi:hypothetical protein
VLLKSWLYRNNKYFKNRCKTLLLALVLFGNAKGQIANYVGNGSFEDDCNINHNYPIYWPGIDSLLCNGGAMFSNCPAFGNVPLNGFTYQVPRTGGAYMLCGLFILNNIRGYFSNRLRAKLEANKAYCVKFYINISNNSSCGMDSFGAYFADGSLDTISICDGPLTYLTPQIQHPTGTIITDTLNWTLVTGTFVATGNEKYMVIGNFKPDNLVNYAIFNPHPNGIIGTDVCLDDVSCIPLDLPAFAGHDTSFIPGTSVYIGRKRDVGIDEACMWYKLPIVITPTTPAIDTAAGIWVNPIATSTYVVRQEICGNVKWDTVVVYQTAVGLLELGLKSLEFSLYPNPANENLNITGAIGNGVYKAAIYDTFGQVLREEEIIFQSSPPRGRVERGLATIKTDELANGVYVLKLRNKTQTVSKRFVINR